MQNAFADSVHRPSILFLSIRISIRSMISDVVPLLLSLAGVVAAPALASGASFVPLGDLPGGAFGSSASAISADGSTVVGSSDSGSGHEAFVWTRSGGIVGLGDLADGNFDSRATSVSADGSTIVGRGTSGQGSEAVLWTASGGMTRIDLQRDGLTSSDATGVSADGSTVVGIIRGFDQPQVEAFRWTPSGGAVGLGFLPQASSQSFATSVSGDGSNVAGFSRSPERRFEAFVWNASTGMVGLVNLQGGGPIASVANAISADGSTVVGTSGSEAFRWFASSGMVGLGRLPGDLFSEALAVSADGSTVVGRGRSDAGSEAFIWTEGNGLQSLQVLLTALGVDLTGWQLVDAAGVSADGLRIVGSGINPSGQREGFVAIVPEPGTGLLVGMGLIGLGTRRARRGPTRVIS